MRREKDVYDEMQRKVDQFELPVEDFVWEKVSQGVATEKRKRRTFIWFFIAGAFCLALILVLFSSLQRDPSSTISLTGMKKLEKKTFTVDQSNRKKGETSVSTEEKIESRSQSPVSFVIPTESPVTLTKEKQGKITVVRDPLEVSKPIDHSLFEENESTEVPQLRQDEFTENTESDATTVVLESHVSTEVATEPDSLIQAPSKRWSLMAMGGGGWSFRTLKSDLHHELIAHRNGHESQALSFSFSLLSRIQLSKRSLLQFGGTFSRYAEKYAFHHDIISHSTTNTYDYVQVPVTYGFNIVNNRGWQCSLLGGLEVGRLTSAQSSWVDPSLLSPVAHDNINTKGAFTSWTFGIHAGLDVGYRTKKGIGIHLMPMIDRLMNSVYERQTGLIQHPYSIRMNLGISYEF